MSNSPEIFAPKAQQLRRERVARLTQMLVSAEGQTLDSVVNQFSLSTGVSKRTIEEYWEIISNNNQGPIYEKRGLVKVRKLFRRHLS